MNNVIKNNTNFQDMKFCQIIETNNYIQNYDSDIISDTDSNSDSGSYCSYNSSSSFSPISLNSNYSNSTNSTNSNNSLSSLDEENNYWLRPYSAKFRSRLKTQTQTQTPRQTPIQISNVYGGYNKNSTSEHTSGLDKDCPFIENLINKRINSCIVGPSSHIAAFLPSTVEIRSCFIPSWKRKGRNR